jgi:hypothetical protein
MNGKLRPTFDSDGNVLTSSLKLAAEFGRINLASVANQGEVTRQPSGLYLSAEMQGGQISAHNTQIDVSGKGGGSIFILGGDVELINTLIYSQTKGDQNGRRISFSVDNLVLRASVISSNTLSSGEGGIIVIKVAETLNAKELFDEKVYSGIFADSRGDNAGKAGRIEIEARQLKLSDGAIIASETYGTGEGGNIILFVADTITISGVYEGVGTGISVSTMSTESNAGNAGHIKIETHQMFLKDAVQIQSATFGPGEGGSINVKIIDMLVISGKTRANFGCGIYGASLSRGEQAGKAGKIIIQADTVNLIDGGVISTASRNASGGNINITSSNLLYLQSGGGITTSVHGGKDDGGNITIENPTFVVMDKGKIIAQADEGHGGNIRIVAEHFIASPDSLISASSRLGLDGNVQIEAPDEDISGALLVLPAEMLDASGKMKQPCTLEQIQNPNTLFVKRAGGSASLPYDWQPGGLVLVQPEDEATYHEGVKTPPDGKNARLEQLASLTGCRPVSKQGTRQNFSHQYRAVKKSSVIPEQLF